MVFKVTVDATKVIQALGVIATKVPEAVQATLKRAAEEAIQGAQSDVPVDTGALRDSIRIMEQGENYIVVGAGDDADLKYAAYVEFGTSKMVAQPYMGPQADKMNSRLAEIFVQELNKRLK
jgi:HK97 gp10 family phage protein